MIPIHKTDRTEVKTPPIANVAGDESAVRRQKIRSRRTAVYRWSRRLTGFVAAVGGALWSFMVSAGIPETVFVVALSALMGTIVGSLFGVVSMCFVREEL